MGAPKRYDVIISRLWGRFLYSGRLFDGSYHFFDHFRCSDGDLSQLSDEEKSLEHSCVLERGLALLGRKSNMPGPMVNKKRQRIVPRRTGYSLFCMEKANEEEFKNCTNSEKLRLFGERWRMLPAAQKAEFKIRAASLEPPCEVSWKKKEWHRLAKKIRLAMEDMSQLLPTEGFILLNVIGGEQVCFGTPMGSKFLDEYPGLVTTTFRAFLEGAKSQSVPDQQVTAKTIQEIFNQKYSESRGVEGMRFPYASFPTHVDMEGLPTGIPLRHPSKYGMRQLRAIFHVKDQLKCIIKRTPSSDKDEA